MLALFGVLKEELKSYLIWVYASLIYFTYTELDLIKGWMHQEEDLRENTLVCDSNKDQNFSMKTSYDIVRHQVIKLRCHTQRDIADVLLIHKTYVGKTWH